MHFFFVFPWFQNVQYALITGTLINDVKEILEVLFSF